MRNISVASKKWTVRNYGILPGDNSGFQPRLRVSDSGLQDFRASSRRGLDAKSCTSE